MNQEIAFKKGTFTMKKIITVTVFLTIILFCFTSCKASDYKTANELLVAQDYAGAATIFESLENYKDSAVKLAECNEMLSAINKFNSALQTLSDKNDAIKSAIDAANELVQSDDKALDESLRPTLETAISTAKAEIVTAPERPATATETDAVAEEIESVDYSDVTEQLEEKKNALEKSMKQYALVNAPSESYIIQCLQKVDGVIDISAATEENDPNGHLHKAGGYSAAVYFSHKNVNQSSVYGDTIIDKGTSCGGQIEVYESEEDAQQRNDYLAGFDGTLFDSGSHTVIGTVLVRTSDELTATQQKELEANIIAVLIALE